jgi:enolase
MDSIKDIQAIEALNAKGRPTVEAMVTTESGIQVIAAVPSGTSTGAYEAHEVRDGGERYEGRGCRTAAANVCGEIRSALLGMDVTRQSAIDRRMIELDGTENKGRLGSNAILAVSIAVCKAAAASCGLPVYQYIGGAVPKKMPNVMATVISGGDFSQSKLEFEDYMLKLEGFPTFADTLENLAAVRRLLEKKLRAVYGAFPDDGGALAPPMSSTTEAFDYMLEAIRVVGCENYITLGLDVAANGPYDAEKGRYVMTEGEMDSGELLDYYRSLAAKYPLTYIEDPFEENDFESFARLKTALPGVQIVGDDLFATNIRRLEHGVAWRRAQNRGREMDNVGASSAPREAANFAKQNGYDITVSTRSGDTTDSFIADLAVGVVARQVKHGSPVRGERNAKYNRLLWIEHELRQM